MASFRSAKSQAAHVMKKLQGKAFKSVGTVRNYEERLTQISKFLQKHRTEEDFKNKSLKDMTPNLAQKILACRSHEVGQKTLDMERQALQAMLRHVTHDFGSKQRLLDEDGHIHKSDNQQELQTRFYTSEQVDRVKSHQDEHNALATEIAYAAGLRAEELRTLRLLGERVASDRPANEEKFRGLEGDKYTVHGKGGLVREVIIPSDLAKQLEEHRFPQPIKVHERNVDYEQHYNVGGGKAWSSSFSTASKTALGWSNGAHGLRHAYAQNRMEYLRHHGLSHDKALETTSQEMGHFRPDITNTYLR